MPSSFYSPRQLGPCWNVLNCNVFLVSLWKFYVYMWKSFCRIRVKTFRIRMTLQITSQYFFSFETIVTLLKLSLLSTFRFHLYVNFTCESRLLDNMNVRQIREFEEEIAKMGAWERGIIGTKVRVKLHCSLTYPSSKSI